jgi:hypothetical protein
MIKHDAIYDCYPQVGYIRDNDAFDRDGNPVLYDEAVVLAYMESKSYIEKRKRAYPSFGEQFDILYHGGYDAWKATIQQIKDEIPKP